MKNYFPESKMDGNNIGKKNSKQSKKGGRRLFLTEMDRTKEQDKEKAPIELEHVLGMTVYTSSALTCDPRTGLMAYPAGCVLVLLDSVKYKAEVATLRGHSVGIASVSFSPRMREIIVVGDAQDMMISVWAWPSKVMKALNKFADEIYAMAISEDSRFFVTVGNRHVKFYYIDNLRSWPKIDSTCPIPLPTRCGMLDNLKENCFCDVVCGRGCSNAYIFVIAVSGILCQVNRNRLLERWVNVNMETACCLTADENNVFVGGIQGLVRIFRALDLQILQTLPRPHSLGLDISQVTSSYIEDPSDDSSPHDDEVVEKDKSTQYPATRALCYDPTHENLTVVYDDHSIYIWARDMKDEFEDIEWYHFRKKYSSMYHRGCVWDLTTYPVAPEADSEEGALGGALPPGALISVSADGTLRAWDVCAKICEESVLKRNCLSPECLKIVYADKMDVMKRSRDKTRQQCKSREGSASSFARHGKQSFSVVAVCPDGLHIATGNRFGRVCIYDTNSMNVMTTMLAHEAEVTALGYSITKRYKVLASGSRDRMIHVMDASRGYQLLTTLDDHSSTITAINFTYIARCLLMVTSSLDMSVLVRAYLDSDVFSFKPVRAIVEKKSVMDFTIHPWSGLMALACQDRLVRIYSIMSSVENNSFRGCPSYGGQLIRIQIDPSGQYLLTACSNKTINLLQFNTGALLSTFNGHAESITCIKFSHNMKHVISSAVDGCIFLWRLPESVTYCVKREMAEMGRLTRGMVLSERWKKSRFLNGVGSVDVISDASFKLLTDGSPELKPVYDAEENGAEQEKRPKSEWGAYLIDAQASETKQHGQVQASNVDADTEVKPGAPTSHEMIEAPPRQTSADCAGLKVLKNQSQTSQISQLYTPDIRTPTSFGPASEAWLTACYERRRIFKLEARSIKKVLAMMRLVTDVMEKDLANADWLMYSGADLGSYNTMPNIRQSPAEVGGPSSPVVPEQMEMVLSTSTRSLLQEGSHHQLSLTNVPTTDVASQLALPEQEYHHIQQQQSRHLQQHQQLAGADDNMGDFLPDHAPNQANVSHQQRDAISDEQQLLQMPSQTQTDSAPVSDHIISKPIETLTIKLSTDTLCGEMGSFTFLNELEGFHYASAVHCISEVLEQRQKMHRSSSTSILRQSFLQCYNTTDGAHTSHFGDVVDSEESDDDEKEFCFYLKKPPASTHDGNRTSCINGFGDTESPMNDKVFTNEQIDNDGDNNVGSDYDSEFDHAEACFSITDNCNTAVLDNEANLLMENSNSEVRQTYSYDNVFSYVVGNDGACGLLDGGNPTDSQAKEDKTPSIQNKSQDENNSPRNVESTGLDGYLKFLFQECNNAEHRTEFDESLFSQSRNVFENRDASGNCIEEYRTSSCSRTCDEGSAEGVGKTGDASNECNYKLLNSCGREEPTLIPTSLLYYQADSETADCDEARTWTTTATDHLGGPNSWTCSMDASHYGDQATTATDDAGGASLGLDWVVTADA